MLQLKDFMPVNFLKKEKYTGSCKGMRFAWKNLKKKERTPHSPGQRMAGAL